MELGESRGCEFEREGWVSRSIGTGHQTDSARTDVIESAN